MVLKSINFDKTSSAWTRDREFNDMFLLRIERFINDIIYDRGYIYLNQIYEMLGLKWNPEDENPCIRKHGEQLRFMEFELFHQSNNTVLIHIHCY